MRKSLLLLTLGVFTWFAGQSGPLHGYALEGAKWSFSNISLNLQATLPGTTFPLIDGSASFNDVAQDAINDWNVYLSSVQLVPTFKFGIDPAQGDNINSVCFSSGALGQSFGADALAVTLLDFDPRNGNIIEADVVFNTAYTWDSYRGNLLNSAVDFRRVADHEFGHVLGLDHPDEADPAQNVTAIMNSVISNLDHIEVDDIQGVESLYGNVSIPETVTASASPPQGGNVTGAGDLPLASEQQLVAVPASGFIFDHWDDGSTASTRTITVPIGGASYTAFFVTAPVAPTIINGPPTATASLTVPYSFTYETTGTPTPTFTLASGTLPPGLVLSAAGTLTGTPTSTGTYSGVVDASNGVSPEALQKFTITVTAKPIAPTISNGPPPSTTVNTPYSFTYKAKGTPAPAFSLASGTLPVGLSLSSTGVLSGTPLLAGKYAGVVTATNGADPDATQAFDIVVTPKSVAPKITNGPPASTARVGTAFSFTYLASGFPAATFKRSSGSLPPGLTLATDGTLSGTPTKNGTYTGIVTATNGVSPSATQSFSISVQQSPVITSSSPPDTTLGLAYSFTYTAIGSPDPTFSLASGSLPPGLKLTSSGALFGTTTKAGVYAGSVKASNGLSPSITQAFSITVSTPHAPVFTSGPPPTGGYKVAYSFTFTASGHPDPTFALIAGALPPGLTLGSSGKLSGTPTKVGTYTGTVRARNSVNPFATQDFTLTIGRPYTSWAGLYFTSAEMKDPAISGPTAEPQHDGIANLLKYVCNIDPSSPMTVRDRASLPAIGLAVKGSQSYLTLTYRQYTGLFDATVGLQTSSTLSSWKTVTPSFDEQTGTDAKTKDPILEIGVKATGEKQFLRLNIEQTGP